MGTINRLDHVGSTSDSATWIVRLDPVGTGVRLAVKDCIDVEGLPTTVGCPVIAERARSAARDAAVVAAARRSGVRIVGKTNLAECAGLLAERIRGPERRSTR